MLCVGKSTSVEHKDSVASLDGLASALSHNMERDSWQVNWSFFHYRGWLGCFWLNRLGLHRFRSSLRLFWCRCSRLRFRLFGSLATVRYIWILWSTKLLTLLRILYLNCLYN